MHFMTLKGKSQHSPVDVQPGLVPEVKSSEISS